MSVLGNGSLSIRKQDVREQKNLTVGFKKLTFAHKATLGDTIINLTALVTPTEMSSMGFVNPSSGELIAAQLFFYRKNLTLISSIRGPLMDYLSYDVSSSSAISLNGFTAADGEIFIGVIDYNARNGYPLVDAAPLVSTGLLTIGNTDFNVGQVFEVNKYSSQQVGAVSVFRNGVQQFRNTNNSSVTLDGNYYEVNNGSGSGQIIRFNSAAVGQDDSILVISNGLLAYNPDGSALQQIETLGGQIDAMIPTLAALAGVPQTNFQAAPNNTDLKSFGDTVLAILNTPIPVITDWFSVTVTGGWTGGNVSYNGLVRQVRDTIEVQVRISLTGAPTGTTLTIDIPLGLTIDTSKIANAANTLILGAATLNDSGTTFYKANVMYNNTTSVTLRFETVATQVVISGNTVTATAPFSFNTGDAVSLTFSVPVVGLSTTQTLRQLAGL